MNKFVLGLIVLVVVVAGYMALTGNDAPEVALEAEDGETAMMQDAVEADGGESMEEGDSMMEEKDGEAMEEEGHMEGEEHMEGEDHME